jgi:hypothetical protein
MSKKKDPLGPWTSAWLVTINTNSTNRAYIRPLKIIWNHITTHMSEFMFANIPEVQITRVRQTSTIEEGSKFHRIHLHSQLEVSSRGLAMLNYSKIKSFTDRQLSQIPGFVGVHVKALLVRNYNATVLIQEYLEKAPIEELEELEFKIF